MVSFKIKDILDTSEGVKNNIEIYGNIPETVNVVGTNYLMSQFTDVMIRTVLQLDPNQKTINYNDVLNRPVNLPVTSIESLREGRLYLADYVDIADRIYGFINRNMKLPTYANTPLGQMSWQNIIYVFSRILTWYKNNGYMPKYATVTPWKRKPAIGGDSPSKGPIQTACEKLLGPFTSFTGFYNKMIGRGYKNEMNDTETLYQELSDLADFNCVNATQVAILLAREMGYTARFCHVYCTQSGTGHIYGQIAGKEFGTGWIKFDLAAAMSVSSKYPLGRVWCSDARIVAYNEAWLESDDGIT